VSLKSHRRSVLLDFPDQNRAIGRSGRKEPAVRRPGRSISDIAVASKNAYELVTFNIPNADGAIA
jgi:hypothetical protein